MPKYRYNVINQENKSLSGTINAPDEQGARNELNQLGFSVIDMAEIPENEAAVGEEGPVLPTFEFGGIDKSQKKVVGTIQAEDRYNAFKRLMTEYAFEVEYLVDQSLPEEQKSAEKIKGVFELQNMIDEEAQLLQKKMSGETKDMQEFEEKQDSLKTQVDFVLQKVKAMLDQYENDMKPEHKAQIRKLVDKILRIKSSTNLDYIRKSCEELLIYLQNEELFLQQEARTKERTQLVVEAKSMMMQLHSSKNKTSMSLHEMLNRWRDEHIVNNDHPSAIERLLDFFVGAFIGFMPENAAITDIRHKITILDQQIKQYFILYIQAESPEFKAEAKTGLKKLRLDKKKLKRDLKEAKKQAREEYKKRTDNDQMETFSREILSFSGWLLAFYLLYYFVSIYLNTKEFGIAAFPHTFSIYKSNFLKYFLSTLFLFHASLSIKVNFFRRNETATLIITPIFLLVTILIILNF